MARRPCRCAAGGFTLVESLVVIGVIGLIIGLVVPALWSVRAESKSTLCLNNLRQLFMAVDTVRQQRQDMLPFAAPLPVPAGQIAVVPGLPEVLKAILPPQSESWMCPADSTQDSEDIATSYIYVAGAFMLLEPPVLADPADPLPTAQANADRVSRLITERFTRGYLHDIALIVDSGDYHNVGNRQPRNGVFIDGNARVLKPQTSNPGSP